MSPDEAALLAAVFAVPDDDTPRLVYADWLDEHGTDADAARAEFIRLQCDRARNGVRGITSREYELMKAWGPLWRAELPEGMRDGLMFRRGFASRVRCSAAALFRAWQSDAHVPPVERLEVTIADAHIDWLDATRPLRMPPLKALVLRCHLPVGAEALRLLARLGPHDRLESLTVGDPYMGDAAVAELAPEPAFPALRHLDLTRCGIGDAGAEALAESAWPGRLRRLVLAGNPISESRLRWLFARFGASLVV